MPRVLAALVAAGVLAYGQAQRGPVVPLGVNPKPAVPSAKPARSCESLAMVALPNATIESATFDPNNPAMCRVTAITAHPAAGDKVKSGLAFQTRTGMAVFWEPEAEDPWAATR